MSAGARSVANVFCGTSDFAATVLRGLAASPHSPSLVVTPTDRPRGRGRKLSSPPVADLARELGLELHQTAGINDPDSRRAVLDHAPEFATVCAFGQLIKQPLIGELPMLNIHPSLLPRWRGAAPVERAIIAGDAVTGVCVMKLTEGLDSGPVALRGEIEVAANDTYGTLAPRLAELGSRLLIEALDLAAAGDLTARFAEQGEEGVTYAEKLSARDRRVDPSRPAAAEVLRVRALTPQVGAFAELVEGGRVGLRSTAAVGTLNADDGEPADQPGPGEFAEHEGALFLGCTPGALRIAEIQPEGGRWMAAGDYLRGRGVPPGVNPANPS
ncbi:MAG: methionyl-tRNA formyltransferase [Solirubrobacterales bacterium]